MGQLQEKYKHYREPQKFMEADVYPYFRAIEGKQGTEVEMGGHKVLMFGSNAYTGLTGDQRIIDAAKAALDKYGSGCAGSRFLNGTLDLHVQLEKEISEYIGKDDCLCFSTGFSVILYRTKNLNISLPFKPSLIQNVFPIPLKCLILG